MMEIERLVIDSPADGRFMVHRSALTSPEVFALERGRVFDHTWLFVGHESEIPDAGDFRTRSVGGRPLIFVRGSDGEVRVLYNTCRHRGAQVCRLERGRAQGFQCFYHAWSYDTNGSLIGVPDEGSYDPPLVKSTLGLKAPPRVEQYRGMFFVSYDPQIVDLKAYLGEACEYIDLTLDSADIFGGWTVLRGSAHFSVRANWKLLVENSFDDYHFATVHKTYIDYMAWRARLNGKERVRAITENRALAFPHGHAAVIFKSPGRGIANPSPLWDDDVNSEVERIKAANISRFGEGRGREMCEFSRQLIIHPNLMFQDTQSGFRFRLVSPLAPDLMEVHQWELVPREESPQLRAARMELSLAFLGPGGLATPDDIEALESCQRGFAAREVEWSDLSRGMGREPAAINGELQLRAFWRQWHAHLRDMHDPVRIKDAVPISGTVAAR